MSPKKAFPLLSISLALVICDKKIYKSIKNYHFEKKAFNFLEVVVVKFSSEGGELHKQKLIKHFCVRRHRRPKKKPDIIFFRFFFSVPEFSFNIRWEIIKGLWLIRIVNKLTEYLLTYDDFNTKYLFLYFLSKIILDYISCS